MHLLRILFVLLFIPLGLFSQGDVTGVVVDESTNEPLAFASIGVKSTARGTISNEDGAFVLSGLSLTDTLVVSYLGYYSAEFVLRDLNIENVIRLRPKSIEIKTFTVSADSDPYFDIIVACRKRLVRKSKHQCKAYLELHTNVNDTPGEIIDMYYNADLRSGNLNDLSYKSGRQALAKIDNSFFLSLSTTSIFQTFKLAEGNVDMPDNPLEMSKKKMMKTYELSLLSSDADDYYHLQFKPKKDADKIFEGEIWIDKSTYDPIEVKLKIEYAAVKPFVPIFPTDSLADTFMQITQRFNRVDDHVLPSLLRFEYGFDSYTPIDTRYPISVKNLGSIKPVRSDGVMYYYDYDDPFFTPVFDYAVDLNDYQKIQNTPYHPNFWQVESALVESERMEKSIAFFEQHGRLTNHGDTPLDTLFVGMGSYMDHTNSFWSDSTRLAMNEDFLRTATKADNDVYNSAPIRTKYLLDVKVYLDIVETPDTLFYYTESVFDVYNSYFNLPFDSLTNDFVNIYFDLAEIARRELEQRLASEPDLTTDKIAMIYQTQMVALRKKHEKYMDDTGSGRKFKELRLYNIEVDAVLGVNNFEFFKIE